MNGWAKNPFVREKLILIGCIMAIMGLYVLVGLPTLGKKKLDAIFALVLMLNEIVG